MRERRRVTILGLAAFAALLATAGAQTTATPEPFEPPCAGKVWWADSDATFGDFDFWVGTWQVYDTSSGELMGFDEIVRLFGGCALRQHWRQMNDRFSLAGAPWRLEGGSFTTLGADGRWHQTWLDNGGSSLPLAGGLDPEGVMVLESEWLEFRTRAGDDVTMRYRWHWDPQDDGTIHNWGFVARAPAAAADEVEWQKYFDIVYRRNAPGGPSAMLQRPETE